MFLWEKSFYDFRLQLTKLEIEQTQTTCSQ